LIRSPANIAPNAMPNIGEVAFRTASSDAGAYCAANAYSVKGMAEFTVPTSR